MTEHVKHASTSPVNAGLATNRVFAERVRELFNSRADAWGRLYGPEGRLVWRLAEFAEPLKRLVPAPAKILDFGCGTGDLSMHLWSLGYRVTGCDIADLMIAAARRNFGSRMIEWVDLELWSTRLPFASESFDAVVASSVLEYVDDPELLIGEIARVMQPDGFLLFNVPDPQHPRRKRESLAKHVTDTMWIRRLACAMPRFDRYRRYLELSKNRWSMVEWETLSNFYGLDRIDPGTSVHRRPLALLAFQKCDRGAPAYASRQRAASDPRLRAGRSHNIGPPLI